METSPAGTSPFSLLLPLPMTVPGKMGSKHPGEVGRPSPTWSSPQSGAATKGGSGDIICLLLVFGRNIRADERLQQQPHAA